MKKSDKYEIKMRGNTPAQTLQSGNLENVD